MVARAAAVLKIVSQRAVNLRLLVRAALTCTRISVNVRTLNRRAATTAAHQSHAVLQLVVVMATVVVMVMATATPALQPQLAVLRLHVVLVAATAAMQTQAAVLQLHVGLVAATAAMQIQAAVLQLHVMTAVATTLAAAKAATAATMTAVRLPS